jgi:DNA-binding NtrC family response regulator
LLLIDDDVNQIDLLIDRFQENGPFTFEVAKNSSDAISILAHYRGKIDAIIAELHIPKQNGLDLVQAIRSLGFNTPFFILTADRAIFEKEVIKMGATGLFYRPVSILKLAAAVRKAVLDQKHGRSESKKGSKT